MIRTKVNKVSTWWHKVDLRSAVALCGATSSEGSVWIVLLLPCSTLGIFIYEFQYCVFIYLQMWC